MDKCIKSGKLIAFEGLDCSFKETNSKVYLEYLLSKGEKAVLYSFPRYEKEQSVFVREYLAGTYGKQENIHPKLIATFYMIDMFDCAQKEIIPKLKEGYTVILDRYWYSNIFYRLGLLKMRDSAKELEEFIVSWVEEVDRLFWLPNADIIVKLKSDPEVMLDFIHKKNSSGDQHESNDEFLLSAARVFDTINLSKYARKVVDVYTTKEKQIRSKEDIFADIVNGIENE